MKSFKKLAGLALALIMALALMAPAMAVENPGTITLKNPSDTPDGATHTYNVYRVFDMTKAETGTAVSYTVSAALKEAIAGDETVNGYFTFGNIANDTANFTVTPDESYNTDAAKTFSTWLSNKKALLTKVNTEAIALTGSTGTETLAVPYGYYFVDSTVGSLFMLDSTTPEVEITDKNETPTSTKTWNNDDLSKQIGDTVTFTITTVAKEGAKAYVVHDVMGAGLTLNASSITVTPAAAADAATIKTTELTDDCTFEVSFAQTYLDTITEDTEIVITYSAVINASAVSEKVGNKSQLEYGDNKFTPWSEVGGQPDNPGNQVFDFDLVKTTSSGAVLPGASFELYRGEEIVNFLKDGNQYTVCAAGTENAVTTIEAGNVRINGLGAVEYTLKETAAPAGYNKLAEDVTVDMTDKADKNATVTEATEDTPATWTDGGVQVINYTGAELPSTGGIGTTIFYTLGGLLLVGSVILFVTKKRTGMAD